MNARRPFVRNFYFLFASMLCCPCLYAAPQLFHFRNGFWINLHHYLYAQALANSDTAKGRLRSSAEDAIKNAPCGAIPEAHGGSGADPSLARKRDRTEC
jgi:hypothetical protein